MKQFMECPCHKGYVVREIESCDYDRSLVFEHAPIIECDECKKKYKVIVVSFQKRSIEAGRHTDCYLVPIDFNETVKYDESLKPIKTNELNEDNFANYLACIFAFDELKMAFQDLEVEDDPIYLKRYAKKIYDLKVTYFNDDDLYNIKQDIEEAIELYDSYPNNFNKLRTQDAKNRLLNEKFYQKLKKEGIHFEPTLYK